MYREIAASVLAVSALLGGALAQTTYELAISGAKSQGVAATTQDLTISGSFDQQDFYQAGVIDGKIYVIGGTDGTYYMNKITEFEISGDTVTATEVTVTGNVPEFKQTKAVSTNEKIYVQGIDYNTNIFLSVDASGVIENLDTTNQDHYDNCLAASGDSIYSLMGWSNFAYSNRVLRYSISGGSWQDVTPSIDGPVARKEPAAAIIGDQLFMYSGTDDGGQLLSDFWKLDLTDPSNLVWEAGTLTGNLPADITTNYLLPGTHDQEPLIYISRAKYRNQLAYVYTADEVYTDVDDLPATDGVVGETGVTMIVSPNQLFHLRQDQDVHEARLITLTGQEDPNDNTGDNTGDNPGDSTGDETEDGGFFSSPVGIAVLAAAAIGVGAAVYFFVIAPTF